MTHLPSPSSCSRSGRAATGYSVDNDLPGDDRPEQVDAMYAAALGWLHGG